MKLKIKFSEYESDDDDDDDVDDQRHDDYDCIHEFRWNIHQGRKFSKSEQHENTPTLTVTYAPNVAQSNQSSKVPTFPAKF